MQRDSLERLAPHRSPGGQARRLEQRSERITCRVEFIDGEPATHTAAEQERLVARGLTGVRLACQILCDHDMTVRAISRLEGSGRADPGGAPTETIAPPPVWV